MGSFVVSIAHYMRAYFNDQALNLSGDFSLPGNAGCLNVSIFNIDYPNLNCLSAYPVTISNQQTNACPQCLYSRSSTPRLVAYRKTSTSIIKQALNLGEDFLLPGNTGYLNVSIFNIDYPNLNCLSASPVTISNQQTNACPQCVFLQETESAQQKLYAKIGCISRNVHFNDQRFFAAWQCWLSQREYIQY